MRVWAFPSIYPFDRPGSKHTGIFAHRQYKALIKCGAEVSVIVPINWYPPFPIYRLHTAWRKSARLDYPTKRVYEGVTVYHPRIANIKPSRFEKRPYTERYINSIIGFFKKNKIVLDPNKDIFFSQWIPDGGLAQMAAKKLGIKSCLLSIGDDVVVYPYQNESNKDFFIKATLAADGNYTVADYLGRETNKIVGRQLHYDVIHMGADYRTFKPGTPEEVREIKKQYNIPADKVIILNIASSIVRKGWLDLFDALQEIKKTNNNFSLAAVYGTPYDLNLAEEAAKRGLTEHFLNLGSIAPEKLNAIYKAADIFCLPSHWEGISVANMEAMSSGLSVITTNVCGHPELIKDGETGILIPPKRVEMLTEKLATLINDSSLRTTLGRNARDFMINEWGSYFDNAKLLYAKLSALLTDK